MSRVHPPSRSKCSHRLLYAMIGCEKLRLYARAEVQEYWVVQPYPAVIEILQLAGSHYRIDGAYTDIETLRSPTFPELNLDLSAIFTLPVPPANQIDEIRESAPPYDAGHPAGTH